MGAEEGVPTGWQHMDGVTERSGWGGTPTGWGMVDGYGGRLKGLCQKSTSGFRERHRPPPPPTLCPLIRKIPWLGPGKAGLQGNRKPRCRSGDRGASCPTPTPFLPATCIPSPAVPTDLVRGMAFRREPGSFSGPGRPWRSNSDCGGRGAHMEVLGPWDSQFPTQPHHPFPKPQIRHPMR